MRFYPPSTWQPGETVRDDYDVNLNPGMPAGQYTLEVSLLGASGEELPAIQGGVQHTAVPLGKVSIVLS